MAKSIKTAGIDDFEKAAGMISLAADKGAAKGLKSEDCLTGEELSTLLDGRCEKEDVVRIKEHISNCEECYNQWLTLVSFKMGAMKTAKIYPVRSRKFTYIGSALALAASIMIFLNVADIDVIPVMDQFPAKEESLSESPAMSVDIKELDAVQPEMKAAAPQPMAVKATKKKRLMPEKTAGVEKVENRMTQEAETSEELYGSGLPGNVYSLWMEQVVESCRGGGLDEKGWGRLHSDARELLEVEGGTLSQMKKDKISAILPLLQRLSENPFGGQCSLILTILAEG